MERPEEFTGYVETSKVGHLLLNLKRSFAFKFDWGIFLGIQNIFQILSVFAQSNLLIDIRFKIHVKLNYKKKHCPRCEHPSFTLYFCTWSWQIKTLLRLISLRQDYNTATEEIDYLLFSTDNAFLKPTSVHDGEVCRSSRIILFVASDKTCSSLRELNCERATAALVGRYERSQQPCVSSCAKGQGASLVFYWSDE